MYQMIQNALQELKALLLSFGVKNRKAPVKDEVFLDRLMLPCADEVQAFPSTGFGDIEVGMAYAADLCYVLAKRAGWWDGRNANDPVVAASLIALMHSELSEALEGIRKNTMDTHLPHRSSVEVELADTIIRIMDFAGARGLDIGGAMIEKLAYNVKRADHSREARAADGGKVI